MSVSVAPPSSTIAEPGSPASQPGTEARHGSRRSRRFRRSLQWLLALAVVVGLSYLALNRVGLSGLATGSNQALQASAQFQPVSRSRLPIIVTALGDFESAQNIDVVSQVEGSVMIISLKPEGSPVKEGEVVCVLDGGDLRNRLTNQEISTRQAETSYLQAVKNREVAEFAVREYQEGTYPTTEQSLLSAVQTAQSQLANSRKTVEWSDRMLVEGYATASQNRADHLTFQRDELNLQGANTSLDVLRRYTRPKMLTSLMASVDQAKSVELSSEAVFRLEQSREAKLRRQIELCTLRAPADGILTYANEQQSRRGASQTSTLIEEGAFVRERQPIFRVPDLKNMRLAARIQEASVAKLKVGQPARVSIDALPGVILNATVEYVRPLVDSRLAAENDVRIYTANVQIENPPATLRPGMTGKAEILVEQTEDQLVIPVRSILQFNGKNYVYVASDDGPTRREVEVAQSSGKLIVVTRGLDEGELVARDPKSLMTQAEREKLFILDVIDNSDADDWDHILTRSPGLTTEPQDR